MTNDPRYEQAKKHIEEVKGFYIHLTIYVIVNLGLFGSSGIEHSC